MEDNNDYEDNKAVEITEEYMHKDDYFKEQIKEIFLLLLINIQK